MCRNIRPLFNFDPPATEKEIHDAALQFVRKLTGMQKPAVTNKEAYDKAIEDVSKITKELFSHLETSADPKNREEETEKRRLKNARRFGN